MVEPAGSLSELDPGARAAVPAGSLAELDPRNHGGPWWLQPFASLYPIATGAASVFQDVGERLSVAVGQGVETAIRASKRPVTMFGPIAPAEDILPILKGLLAKEAPAGTKAEDASYQTLVKHGYESPVPPPLEGMPLVGPGGVTLAGGQAALRGLTGPRALSILLETLGAEGLTKASAATVVPLGKAIGSSAIGEAARQLPGVRQAGKLVSRGFDVPQSLPEVLGPARQGLRDLFTQTSNDAAALEYMLSKGLKGFPKAVNAAAKVRGVEPSELMRLVRDAAEELPRQGEAALAGLSDQERGLVAAVREVSDAIPKLRQESGLIEASLGSGARSAAANLGLKVSAAKQAVQAERELRGLSVAEPFPASVQSDLPSLGKTPVTAGRRGAAGVEAELAAPTAVSKEELASLRQDLNDVAENAAQSPDAPPLPASQARSILERRARELDDRLTGLEQRVKAETVPVPQTGGTVAGSQAFAFAAPEPGALATAPSRALEQAKAATRGAMSEAYSAARAFEAKSGIGLPRVAGEKGSFHGADLAVEGELPLLGRRIDLEAANRISANVDRYLVGHTPWVPLPTQRVAAGFKRYGTAPTGLSTRFGRVRETAPINTLTNVEQEAGKPLMETLDVALPAHIRANTRSIANARALQGVADGWGVRASAKDAALWGDVVPAGASGPEGYRSLGSITGSKSGLQRDIGALLDRTYVHPAVYSAMEDYARALSPQNYGNYVRLARAALRGFKLLYTLPNPQFVERNQEWNVVVSIMRGNRNSVVTGTEAARILRGTNPDEVIRIGKLVGKRGDLLQQAIEDGWITNLDLVSGELGPVGLTRSATSLSEIPTHHGKAMELLARAGAAASEPWKRYIGTMGHVNWTGENWARMMHGLWARSVGMSRHDAALEIVRSYFNYNRDAFTAAENFGRDFIPWLSWVRRIIPLTLRTAFERPGEFAALGARVNEWNSSQGVSPEEMAYLGPWYIQQLGVVLPPAEGQPPGTRRMANLGFLGFADPFQRFAPQSSDYESKTPGGLASGIFRGAISQLRPEIPAILQLGLRRDLFGGGDLTGHPVRLPLYAAYLPEPVRQRLGIELVDKTPIGPDWLRIALGTVGPLGSGPLGFLSDNPKDLARGIAWATSVRIDPLVNEAMGRGFAAKQPEREAKDTQRLVGQRGRLRARILGENLGTEQPASSLDELDPGH